MTTCKDVRSEATAKVVLQQDRSATGLPNHFTVDVGSRRIMRFYIRPRRTTTHGHKVVTTRRNVAVTGWRCGSLSGRDAFHASLYDVVCDLIGYGLRVDAVLDAAEAQGWPDDIVGEAREWAEAVYCYLAEQEGPA